MLEGFEDAVEVQAPRGAKIINQALTPDERSVTHGSSGSVS